MGWAFIAVALLFNPVVPVHLDRETWRVIDWGVALIFAWHTWLEYRFLQKRTSENV